MASDISTVLVMGIVSLTVGGVATSSRNGRNPQIVRQRAFVELLKVLKPVGGRYGESISLGAEVETGGGAPIVRSSDATTQRPANTVHDLYFP